MSKGKAVIPAVHNNATKAALNASVAGLTGEQLVSQLLTEHEKLVLGRRILVAQMILAGKTRMEICDTLQVSPNTVTLTRKWLSATIPDYEDTYTTTQVIARTQADLRSQQKLKSASYRPGSFASLRRKYPAHFLLFNLAEEILTQIEHNAAKKNNYK